MEESGAAECPVCFNKFPLHILQKHADECLSGSERQESKGNKRARVDLVSWCKSPKVRHHEVTSRRPNDSSQVSPSRATRPAATTTTTVSEGTEKRAEETVVRDKAVAEVKVPLAEQMRPNCIAEFVGQSHILKTNSILRKLIQAENIPSMILWGPPGCGKTSLAHVIGKSFKSYKFVSLSATAAGVAQVKDIITMAKSEWNFFKRKTILFLDEIHRFNKLQQDTFLPVVENGTIILIGATTENPSFSLNSALLSRCKVFVFEKLTTEDLKTILTLAIERLSISVLKQDSDQHSHQECERRAFIEDDALTLLANLSDGDARIALNCLSLVHQSIIGQQLDNNVESSVITGKHIREGLLRTHLLYDRKGDEHYNCISALHKSMRGDDADAALYWLGRMLEGGEDPLYVARRLIRFSSEDIGLADPTALNQAVATYQACQSIGMPECEVILAQCVVYMAEAPKSVRIYRAYSRVKECIKCHEGALPGVPLHLRNAPTALTKNLGYGKDYKYNPDHDEQVDQKYLPQCLEGTTFLDQD